MTRKIRLAALILVLLLGALFTAGSLSAAKGTPKAASNSQALLALVCPTVRTCYTAGDGSTMLHTADGGTTWRLLPLPAWNTVTYSPTNLVHEMVTGLACPSASTCFAPVDADCDTHEFLPLLHTVDSGKTWKETRLPESCGPWNIVCPGKLICYAFHGVTHAAPGEEDSEREIYLTTDGGKRWRPLALPSSLRYMGFLGMVCLTPDHCTVVGPHMVGVSRDAGRHWTVRRIPSHTCKLTRGRSGPCTWLAGVACPSSSTCYVGVKFVRRGAAHAGVLVTTNGFRSWKIHPLPGFASVTSLSCRTATTCFGLAGITGTMDGDIIILGGNPISLSDSAGFVVTTNGGTTWRTGWLPAYPFYALSCPSSTVCYVVGSLGRVMSTTDGGATWHDRR